MSNIFAPNRLIESAIFDVEISAKCALNAKIDYDFTGNKHDKDMLDYHLAELAKKENRLKVFREKFAEWENEKPAIVKWALGE